MIRIDQPGSNDLPRNYPELHWIPQGTTVVEIEAGQVLLLYADVEWQLLYAAPDEVYPVHLTFGTSPSDDPLAYPPTATVPAEFPIPVTGPHVRREALREVISGLAAGKYRVGLAGLVYPALGSDALLTVHRIRLTILVINE